MNLTSVRTKRFDDPSKAITARDVREIFSDRKIQIQIDRINALTKPFSVYQKI